MPTRTHSNILQDRDEAVQRAPTLDPGLQLLLCHNHRREHIPWRHHDDDLHKINGALNDHAKAAHGIDKQKTLGDLRNAR